MAHLPTEPLLITDKAAASPRGAGRRTSLAPAPLPPDVAHRLPWAMSRLRARLRAESTPSEARWTWSQLNTLKRIADEAPTTVSRLAEAEHVRRQSMGETVAALRREGLITSEPDASDGRKTLISISAEGRALLSRIPAVREAWLEEAIAQQLTPAECRILLQAARVMELLADS
ncbi:MarR family transcriptional regulator [Streptomyces sp. NPDC088194]|uniref:MarR family winged helix-turn-helix transcriptional regulator n=1 Tax=Streptomyces sp. NPDC088194 TaxID=3154931 RepID=UPI00344F39C5